MKLPTYMGIEKQKLAQIPEPEPEPEPFVLPTGAVSHNPEVMGRLKSKLYDKSSGWYKDRSKT